LRSRASFLPTEVFPAPAIPIRVIESDIKIIILKRNGGASRDRTDDLIRARDALSQLSYGPTLGCVDYQKLSTKKELFLIFNWRLPFPQWNR
jgi:hypothetical protein